MLARIKTMKRGLRSGIHDGTMELSGGIGLTEDIRGETGRVKISGTIDRGVEAKIEFRKKYIDPVIVTYIMTRRGGQSIEARIRDLTEDGCILFLEEPDDQNHMPESMGYIVMEKGSHITANGYRIEAGVHTTDTHRRGGQSPFTGDYIKFEKNFKQPPAVLHTLITYENAAFASTMAQKVTAEGFELAQEMAETRKTAEEETIAWIAFEEMSGKGFITDVRGEVGLEVATKGIGVDNKPGLIIEFDITFKKRPDIVIKGQTMNGSDGYWARGAGAWSAELVKSFAEEDQRSNRERSHAPETFGYAAFEENSILRTVRNYGCRVSNKFKMDGISIRQPLIITWDTNNSGSMGVELKVSIDHGIHWTEWLPCGYAHALPGVPTNGDLDGYVFQFRYSFYNDVEVPVRLNEVRVTTEDNPVIIEGFNIGGLATDGSEWNSMRVLK